MSILEIEFKILMNRIKEVLAMLSENGAKTVIVPMDNLQELANLPASVLGNTDVPFYSNNQMLMQKGILLD
ncbi:hypothetical protein N8289_04065 [Flavobacteriales bacterium]|nr:hypothetical protein [Flavobacteriales bacterium]